MERHPSCKPPRLRVGPNEDYKTAKRRHLRRWFEYRDACVMADCDYQASVCNMGRRKVHFFRAFYGVEGVYIVGARA